MTVFAPLPENAAVDMRAPRIWWVWPWGSGRPSVANLAGFLPGRDVLHIDLDPRRFRGPLLVRTRTSDSGRDGMVTVNGATLAVVEGVPTLSDRDLKVNVRGIPVSSLRAAMIAARAAPGDGQAQPASQGRGCAA